MKQEEKNSERREWLGLNRWKIFGLVVLAAGITIFYVSNVVRIDDLLADIHSLEKEQKELKVRSQLLQGEINKLESPDRIITIARDKLGMILPKELPEKIK